MRVESIAKVFDRSLRVLDLAEASVRAEVNAFEGGKITALYESSVAAASSPRRSRSGPEEAELANEGPVRVVGLGGEAAEHRSFSSGVGDSAAFPSGRVTRSTLQPGWRWSRDVGSAQGLRWCPAPHLGYVVSGRMVIEVEDGTEHRYGVGDAFAVDPPHDAWVEGDEPYVGIDVAPGAPALVRPSSDSVLDSIGNTPLVELRRIPAAGRARVVVKVEGVNPTGSMKDRMALAAIDGAERAGLLAPGGTVAPWRSSQRSLPSSRRGGRGATASKGSASGSSRRCGTRPMRPRS